MTDASGAEADDQVREAAAYNYSIYLMVGMPYLLLGSVGFLVYRGLKRKTAADARLAVESRPTDEGGRLWSPLSPDVISSAD